MAFQLNSPLAAGTGFKLVKLGEMAIRYAENTLSLLGIKPRHFHVLATIADNPEFSQKEISTTLGLDPNIMVGVIDELETAGLAIRRRSSTDRRKYVLEVTKSGQTVLKKGMSALDKGEAEFFAALSEEQKAVLDTLCVQLIQTHTSNVD